MSKKNKEELVMATGTRERGPSEARAHGVLGGRGRFPRTQRRTVVVVVLVVCVGAVGVAVWAFRPRSAPVPRATGSVCRTVVRPIAGQQERARLLLIGDSLLAQPSCALAEQLANAGVETHLHAVPGTGLLTGAVDWQQQLRSLLGSVHPSVVLASFSGNYPFPPIKDSAGKPVLVDTPAFFAAWQGRAAKLSQEVHAAGALLFWVEPPPMFAGLRPARIYAGYLTLGDQTLASGRVLGGAQGEWILSKAACGTGDAPLRAADSVHLTQQGARIFGTQIAHDLTIALGFPAVVAPC